MATTEPVSHKGVDGVDRQIGIVLEEYRQIEGEKRMVAQALLAVTGLLLAAIAAVAANLKSDNLLPLVVLAPATLVAGWAGAVLKAYADEYVVYLSVVEERLQQLCGASSPVMGWNTIWSATSGRADQYKTKRVASIAPMLGAAMIVALAAMVAGLYAMVNSAPLKDWPTGALAAACLGYVAVTTGIGAMLALTWLQRRGRLRSSEAAFKAHLGVASAPIVHE